MRIVTSSWFTDLPDTFQKIGISRGTPRAYPAGFRRMPELAPGPYFRSVSAEEYHRRFMAQLASLDAHVIVAKMEELSAGRDAALLCYEAPDKAEAWCHRAYVSAWLHDQLGIDVPEYSMEGAGIAWAHPKMPSQFRRQGEAQ